MHAINRLLSGYQRFRRDSFVADDYQRLAQGQAPETMVIACCDSRVDPMQITSAMPGEIFVVRHVANLVPLYDANNDSSLGAALEFAVLHLKVKHIVVLGHSQCGGIKSLIENDPEKQREPSLIAEWMQNLQQTRAHVLAQHADADLAKQCYHCELAAIETSLDNLHSFPWIKQRVQSEELSTHGWYFDIAHGQLFTKQGDTFLPAPSN